MSISSGKYTIVNVRQKNLAYLADPNDGTPVAANYEQKNKNEQASFLHSTSIHIATMLTLLLPVERQRIKQWQFYHQERRQQHVCRSG
jgi:hypothetical protein